MVPLALPKLPRGGVSYFWISPRGGPKSQAQTPPPSNFLNGIALSNVSSHWQNSIIFLGFFQLPPFSYNFNRFYNRCGKSLFFSCFLGFPFFQRPGTLKENHHFSITSIGFTKFYDFSRCGKSFFFSCFLGFPIFQRPGTLKENPKFQPRAR